MIIWKLWLTSVCFRWLWI